MTATTKAGIALFCASIVAAIALLIAGFGHNPFAMVAVLGAFALGLRLID